MARGKFTNRMADWGLLQHVQKLTDFDPEYCTLIAKKAGCEPDDFRAMFFYLARTCDRRRYLLGRPDNLGQRRRPSKERARPKKPKARDPRPKI